MNLQVSRLNEKNLDDFWLVHSKSNGGGWCYCVAWWVPVWDGWGDRTEGENRALRTKLFESCCFDGYLLYADSKPMGWCQVIRRDSLPKLVKQFGLSPDAQAWAVTCFFIARGSRRRGLARFLLDEIIKDLKKRKVKRLEAFPRHGETMDEDDLWTGPEQMYIDAGFEYEKTDSLKPVMVLSL